ncbi:hypothetical protein JYU15_01085 [bacterium AH-315-I18]|nr:hypothetical protein [bacterium AH-315-I18]
MAGMDEKLIKAITQQVIAALEQGRTLPTAINPPPGTCDGTFKPEPTVSEPLAPKTHDIPLTGIVTANQLQQAIDDKGYALVSQDARLTPLANDLARLHKTKIKRASPIAGVQGTASTQTHRVLTSNWFWWIDGTCPVVKEVTNQRQRVLTPMANPRKRDATLSVIRDLASATRSGHVLGGVLFVPTAAKVLCYANRCQSLRAIVGTSDQAVEEGVTELGANVLVIEYPQHGKRSVDAMLDRFLSQTPAVSTLVQRALAELHRLG